MTYRWTANRREKIEAMLADDPADPFLRYSLALELEKDGEHEASLNHLAGLQQDAAPYVPAFFMAAQQLRALESTGRSAARSCEAASTKHGGKETATPPVR